MNKLQKIYILSKLKSELQKIDGIQKACLKALISNIEEILAQNNFNKLELEFELQEALNFIKKNIN